MKECIPKTGTLHQFVCKNKILQHRLHCSRSFQRPTWYSRNMYAWIMQMTNDNNENNLCCSKQPCSVQIMVWSHNPKRNVVKELRSNIVSDIQLCRSQSCRRRKKNRLAHSLYVFPRACKIHEHMHSWNLVYTYVPSTSVDTHSCHFS